MIFFVEPTRPHTLSFWSGRSVLAINTGRTLQSLRRGGEGRAILDRIGNGPGSINTRDDLGSALTTLRQRAGLTVRELATRAGLPPATADGYLRGKHLPSPAQVKPFRSLLVACGVTDENELAEWQEALARVRASSDGRVGESRGRHRGESTINPYRGLRHFEPEDAGLFFGREAFVGEVLDRLARLRESTTDGLRLLFIVGASGSGKSSLLRAGIVPAVAGGALGGDGCWSVPVMVPGGDPVGALGNALAGPESPVGSTGVAGNGALLVIDQFEELYTLSDKAERDRFVAALAALGPDTLIVAGLRADFVASVARDATLASSLQDWRLAIPPLSEVELRAVVSGPAGACGVTVDEAMVELVLSDVLPARPSDATTDHGALPLLSHALLSAWEHHTHSRLTVADYQAAGGVHGAVRQIAEQVYQELSLPDRELTRRMFLRLVNVDENAIATRRRVAYDELSAAHPSVAAEMSELLEYFVARRLITADERHIEISHDTLLTGWPRLAEWIAADYPDLRTLRRLDSAANGWQISGRDDQSLMRDSELSGVEEWAGDAGNRTGASWLEAIYLSVRAREAAQDGARQRTRAPRWLVAILTVLLVAAVFSIGYELRTIDGPTTDRHWAAPPIFPSCGAVAAPTTPTAPPEPPVPPASSAPTEPRSAPQPVRLTVTGTPPTRATPHGTTPPGQTKPRHTPHKTVVVKNGHGQA